MVKKLKKMAEKHDAPAGLQGGPLAGAVKDSAQQIWLAGMGAFSKAQQEGGKVFDALVKEGMSLQRRTQAAAEDRLTQVSGKMSAMAEEVSTRAGAQWGKLESIFEERTAKALGKLGVPTAKDLAALSERVDELAAAVAKLTRGTKVAPAKPPAKRTAKKTAAPADVEPTAKPPAKRATRARKPAAPAAAAE